MNVEENWIWGFHSVEACVQCHPDFVLEIQVEAAASDSSEFGKLKKAMGDVGIKAKTVPSLPKMLKEKRTQGVAAKLKSFPTQDFRHYRTEFEEALQGDEGGQWVLLDGIQDPRNFGAILRSAAAFGVKGVFVRTKHQCPPTGVVAQTSAGNLFRVPLIAGLSFNPIFDALEGFDVRILGLETGGSTLEKALSGSGGATPKVLWILGGEGDGIRPGLREKCTSLVEIPMSPGVESLNASAAATVAFYATRQKLGI